MQQYLYILNINLPLLFVMIELAFLGDKIFLPDTEGLELLSVIHNIS